MTDKTWKRLILLLFWENEVKLNITFIRAGFCDLNPTYGKTWMSVNQPGQL
ncbi:MAG: hypothetical protein ACLFT0_19425 [Spirulinaceae cyanobacterium]